MIVPPAEDQRKGKHFQFFLILFTSLTPCRLSERWKKLRYFYSTNIVSYLNADPRAIVLATIAGNSKIQRRLFVSLFVLVVLWERSEMSLRCWPFCQWLPCMARTSERLPKRYSSVLKWGNLHSPAYPLLLASWLACSHLLSKSISGSLSSLSTCTSVEIFFNFVNVCDF